MENIVILQGLTVEQLYQKIGDIIEKKLEKLSKVANETSNVVYLSRKEVATFLKISLPTLHIWTKLGWLRSYKIGNRVLYKSTEIELSLGKRRFP